MENIQNAQTTLQHMSSAPSAATSLSIWVEKKQSSARSLRLAKRVNNKIFAELPLLADTDLIRHVVLHAGAFAEDKLCSLTCHSLHDNPAYEALSYTWMGASFINSICLNHQVFFVTRNVEMALRHLRHKKATQVLWIDLICIN